MWDLLIEAQRGKPSATLNACAVLPPDALARGAVQIADQKRMCNSNQINRGRPVTSTVFQLLPHTHVLVDQP